MEIKKKDSDRAARAFMRYARYGFDRRELHDFEMMACIGGCSGNMREAREMLAVYDTLRLLKYMKKKEVLQAVQSIYFQRRGKRLHRNDISLRVRRFAVENYYDDRTVYRHLAEAKRLFLSVASDL